LTTTYLGQVLAGLCPCGGGVESHLILCDYLHTRWDLDPCSRLAIIDISQKVRGGGCCVFLVSWLCGVEQRAPPIFGRAVITLIERWPTF